MGGAKGLSQSDIVFRMTKVSKTPYQCLIKSAYRKNFSVHPRPLENFDASPLKYKSYNRLVPFWLDFHSGVRVRKIFSWIPDGQFEFKKISQLISIEAITPNPPIWRPGFDSRISYLELEIALDSQTNLSARPRIKC